MQKKLRTGSRVPVRFSVVNYSTVFSYYNVFRIMDPDPEGLLITDPDPERWLHWTDISSGVDPATVCKIEWL